MRPDGNISTRYVVDLKVRQGGDGGAAGEMITPHPRTVLGILHRPGPRILEGPVVCSLVRGLLTLGVLGALACGDPNNPDATTGSLAGVVQDADTDAPIEGVTLVVAGIQGLTGADGRFEIDSVPEGTQQVAATMAGYVPQTVDVEIQPGAIASLSLELVADPDPSPLAITTSTLPSATVDVPYETTLHASGGTPPYRWVLLSDFLTGIRIETDGKVVGTPGFPSGVHHLQVEVRDAENNTASADLTLEVVSPSGLRITSLELSIGDARQPYVDTLTAAGGEPPYTFQWIRLYELGPLTLDTATGVVAGVPGSATGPNGERVGSVVTVRDVVGASAIATVTIGFRPAPLVIITDLPDGRIDQQYRVELMVEGGEGGAFAWSVVSGALPPGLRLSGGPGTLYGITYVEGIPTAVGSYDFTLQATDSVFFATREYTIVIGDPLLSVVTSTLPDANVGTPYSVFLVREGGAGPYQWDVVSGSPPSGISLSSEGELSGTPTGPGDFSFEVRVRDSGDQSDTQALVIHVEPEHPQPGRVRGRVLQS
jgi:hypothetical protein